jgi:hypothetical protein
MGLQLPPGLAPMLDLMGAAFPATDEDQLTQAAADWRSVAAKCAEWGTDLAGAVDYITSANEGPGAAAFAAYMRGQSNMTGLAALGTAAERIAAGHEAAAASVRDLKAAVISVAAAAKANVELAKRQPNPDTAALVAWLAQAGAYVRSLDAATATAIQEG